MIILGIILALLLVLMIKTVFFKPQEINVDPLDKETIDQEKVLKHFSGMIQFKTVSNYDKEKMDMDAFKGFQNYLKSTYPLVHQVCERALIGHTGILYKWQGKHHNEPTVLMSHYDVVPVEEAYWSQKPFGGEVIGACIWGRGTIDTKITLLCTLESAEHLMKQGFIPNQDIYFSFSGDEEVSGQSAPDIVNHLKEQGVRPHLVIDEGGVIIEGLFPGVNKEIALIGVGEKGYFDLKVDFKSQGGHASAPPASSVAGHVAKSICRIEGHKMKSVITAPIKEMFNRLGRHASFGYRLIFSNLWLTAPLLKLLFRKSGGQMNALITTTHAITVMEGSKAYNVMPPIVQLGINSRVLNTDTVDQTLKHLDKQLSGDYTYEVIEKREASKITDSKSQQFKLLEETIMGFFPEVIVSPYLMIAGTDSRHFCDISDHVLRFAPLRITKEELGLIHSNDERIRTETVFEGIQFYIELVKKL